MTSCRQRCQGKGAVALPTIEQVVLYDLVLRFREPMVTGWKTLKERETLLVEMRDADGGEGWGEGVAFAGPWYTEETVKTSWYVLSEFLIPRVLGVSFAHPDEICARMAPIRGHRMAKAGLEGAAWDLFSRSLDQSLAHTLGGSRRRVAVGVTLGISDPRRLVDQVARYLEQGYARVKVKVKPGQDRDLLAAVRARYPSLDLTADANAGYSRGDFDRLVSLDEFGLTMLEQPLSASDWLGHRDLARRLRTPICLDESITSLDDARLAIELGSVGVMNIKYGRVGGTAAAVAIHHLCVDHQIPAWAGGMFESGVGKAHALALSALPGMTLPADLAASSRYWDEDVVHPALHVKQGWMEVPIHSGIGVAVDRGVLRSLTMHQQTFSITH